MLYDPALKKLIHTITRKVFAQLLNEFKRLGAVVVYADLRRIGLYILDIMCYALLWCTTCHVLLFYLTILTSKSGVFRSTL